MAPFEKLVQAEQWGRRAVDYAAAFTRDAEVLASLKRADVLLSEVRQAGYFLCDPGCPEPLKEQARKRLELEIINCK
mgnify:CR=1 FL=1